MKRVRRGSCGDLADVELAVGEVSIGSDAHTVSIELGVGEGSEQGQLLLGG